DRRLMHAHVAVRRLPHFARPPITSQSHSSDNSRQGVAFSAGSVRLPLKIGCPWAMRGDRRPLEACMAKTQRAWRLGIGLGLTAVLLLVLGFLMFAAAATRQPPPLPLPQA